MQVAAGISSDFPRADYPEGVSATRILPKVTTRYTNTNLRQSDRVQLRAISMYERKGEAV